MIVDKLNNKTLYFKGEVFTELFKQLETYTVDTPNGIYKNHEYFYFKVMTYETMLAPQVIESHRKEVDVQIILSGAETIKLYDDRSVETFKEYDSKSDCQFYKSTDIPHTIINLKPGNMAVFFPDDIHGPQYAIDAKPELIKKIVIKIDETLFS